MPKLQARPPKPGDSTVAWRWVRILSGDKIHDKVFVWFCRFICFHLYSLIFCSFNCPLNTISLCFHTCCINADGFSLFLPTDLGNDVKCCEKREACKWGGDPSARFHRSPQCPPSNCCSPAICSPRGLYPWTCSLSAARGVRIHNGTCCSRDRWALVWRGADVLPHCEQPLLSRGVGRGIQQTIPRQLHTGSV